VELELALVLLILQRLCQRRRGAFRGHLLHCVTGGVEQAHLLLAERQNVIVPIAGQKRHQRLDVETLRHDQQLGQLERQAEGAEEPFARKDGQANAATGPEKRILQQRLGRGEDGLCIGRPNALRPQSLFCVPQHIPEANRVLLGIMERVGGHVERDAPPSLSLDQCLQMLNGKDVHLHVLLDGSSGRIAAPGGVLQPSTR